MAVNLLITLMAVAVLITFGYLITMPYSRHAKGDYYNKKVSARIWGYFIDEIRKGNFKQSTENPNLYCLHDRYGNSRYELTVLGEMDLVLIKYYPVNKGEEWPVSVVRPLYDQHSPTMKSLRRELRK